MENIRKSFGEPSDADAFLGRSKHAQQEIQGNINNGNINCPIRIYEEFVKANGKPAAFDLPLEEITNIDLLERVEVIAEENGDAFQF